MCADLCGSKGAPVASAAPAAEKVVNISDAEQKEAARVPRNRIVWRKGTDSGTSRGIIVFFWVSQTIEFSYIYTFCVHLSSTASYRFVVQRYEYYLKHPIFAMISAKKTSEASAQSLMYWRQGAPLFLPNPPSNLPGFRPVFSLHVNSVQNKLKKARDFNKVEKK